MNTFTALFGLRHNHQFSFALVFLFYDHDA